MRRVPVTQLKNRLSEFLRLVKQGETIEVLERSKPIARIEPLKPHETTDEERLRRLIEKGVVTPGSRPPDRSILETPPVPCSVDVVRILLEEREER